MSYLVLDLETTGVDTGKAQILQIGAVYEIPTKPIEDLPVYNAFINDPINYMEPGAEALHQKSGLFKMIDKVAKNGQAKTISVAIDEFLEFIRRCLAQTNDKRVTIAGKNVASFDLVILKRHMTAAQLKSFSYLIRVRTLDPGSLYYPDFGFVPTLAEINQKIRLDKTDVTHLAIDDCIDVIMAIRHKCKVQHV